MTPFLLIPGLNATARVYHEATDVLWRHGAVQIANHLAGDGLDGIARRILADAPPRFGLVGFSLGGYLSFEILRQARGRVTSLALIDTSARPDTPEMTRTRRRRLALARAGKFATVVEQSFAASVHPDHAEDETLRAVHREMALDNGAEVYGRHQEAIITRPDSRSELGLIAVPTVIIVGAADAITPPELAREMHEGVPRSRLVTIADAGHLALLEKPAAVNAALDDWARG